MRAQIIGAETYREVDGTSFLEGLETKGNDKVLLHIPREDLRDGLFAGLQMAIRLSMLPKQMHDRFALFFEGWAEDPREVHDNDAILQFLAGLILVDPKTVLPYFYFEYEDLEISPTFDICGQLFWVSVIFNDIIADNDDSGRIVWVQGIMSLYSDLMRHGGIRSEPKARPAEMPKIATGAKAHYEGYRERLTASIGRELPAPGHLRDWAQISDMQVRYLGSGYGGGKTITSRRIQAQAEHKP